MDAIKKVWSQWETVGEIGTGAFGKVYKAKREQLGNISYAAIKVIHIPSEISEVKDLQRSGMDFSSIHSYFEDVVKNLLNEIKIMESLKTANNIVGIEDYEVVEHTEEIGWDIYIRMELLTDLGTYLESHKLSVKEVVKLGMDICTALIACEKANIIHRDIKLDNVFINQFGSFKLGDFGISKQLEKTQSAISQKGTNMYMAPEVFRGEHYNQTVDIYSLGILMYRLLNNGRFPFMPPVNQMLSYNDAQKAMNQRLTGVAMEPPCFADKELSRIILKACAFSSADRYQSAENMLHELKAYHAASERNGLKTSAENSDIAVGVTDFSIGLSEDSKIKEKYQEEKTFSLFAGIESKDIDFVDKEEEHKSADSTENENEIISFSDIPPSDLKPLPDTAHNHKIEKKKSRKIWIAVIIAVLIAGGRVGYYGYSQYQQKQERLAREAEVAEYNSEIDEARKLLDTMTETVGMMNEILVQKEGLYIGYNFAQMKIDAYEGRLERLEKEIPDLLQYIYKPGKQDLYTYEEAKGMLDQKLTESLNIVEENKTDIVSKIDKMKGYPKEIGTDLISLYEIEFVTLIKDYEQQSAMMSDAFLYQNGDDDEIWASMNYIDALEEVKTAFDQTHEILLTKVETIKNSLSALYLDQ